MTAVLSRTYGINETKGSFYIMNGEKLIYRCKMIELPDLGNQHNISCIPEGIYDVVKYNSTTRGECFHILDVPDREWILIHPGNYVKGSKIDSLGCLLPGIFFTDINFDGFIDVAESIKAMSYLLEYLPEKFKLYIL